MTAATADFSNAAWLAIAIPLVGAVLIALTRHRPNLREAMTLGTALALFATVVSLVPEVMAGGRPGVTLVEMLPGLPLRLEVEPLGMIFALVGSFLWFVTSIYSIGYMRGHHETNQTRFYICFAVALSGTMGVALAGNMMTLFVFYEVLTLSTYPLVAHRQGPDAQAGARTYLGILLSTSIGLQLIAIVWTWVAAGTLDFTPGGILTGKAEGPVVVLLLFLYIYGIGKAALMPVHRWLPAAMVAPTPVSALLHAVAVVKAGVFAVVKVIVYIFGLDLLTATPGTAWVSYMACFTILVASVIALRQDNLKRRLAYSTVSQLSYIILGASLANGLGVIGAGLHIATHAFGKITLFFCAGAIDVALHKKEISQMRGIGRAMPFTMAAFLIGSLSIIGLPPLAGLWSKWYLGLGTLEAGEYAMLAVLMISSLLNVAYLLPIPIRAFFSPAEKGEEIKGLKEAPLPCVLALSISAAGCLLLFFFPDPLFRLVGLIVPG